MKKEFLEAIARALLGCSAWMDEKVRLEEVRFDKLIDATALCLMDAEAIAQRVIGHMERKDKLRIINNATKQIVANMPRRLEQVAKWHFFNGLKEEDVAKKMKLSERMICRKIAQIVKIFAERMGNYYINKETFGEIMGFYPVLKSEFIAAYSSMRGQGNEGRMAS